ncbi:MAG TPA: BON domain-containing protein [Candidatus Saccharimonadales bacterium]|nr:BON domain-containing protein [Candidatus Saccharimonadales bacterium]
MRSNFKFRLPAITAGIVALLFMGACDKKQPDDEEISIAIRGKLVGDSGLQYKQIFVHASKGVVTLSGVVDSEGQRTAAVRYAAAEPGVTRVVDRLALAQPPAERPDGQKEKPLPAARPRARPRWPSSLPVAAGWPGRRV